MMAASASGLLAAWRRRVATRAGLRRYVYPVLLVMTVCLLAGGAAQLVYENDRANLGMRVESMLATNARLLGLWSGEQQRRAERIARLPQALSLARPLLLAPGQPLPDAEAVARFERWVTPVFQSGGYLGYVLATPDLKIVASELPGRTGSLLLPEPAQTARRALQEGSAASPPYPAPERTPGPMGHAGGPAVPGGVRPAAGRGTRHWRAMPAAGSRCRDAADHCGRPVRPHR